VTKDLATRVLTDTLDLPTDYHILKLGFPVSHVFLVSRNTKLNEIHHQFREILHVSRINIFRKILFCFFLSEVKFCFVSLSFI
jgi:hypothetical protein